MDVLSFNSRLVTLFISEKHYQFFVLEFKIYVFSLKILLGFSHSLSLTFTVTNTVYDRR